MARRRSAGGRKKNGGANTSIFDGAEAAAMEVGSSRSYHDISTGLLASMTVGPAGAGDGGATNHTGNYRLLDEAHVDSLLRSIKEVGVTDPISVEVVVGEDGERDIVIVKGHHRTAAVLRLRRESEERELPWLYRPLPCVVRVMGASAPGGDTARLIRQTTSNMVRQDSIWEKAEAYRGLRDGGKTHADIALIMGCDERTVGRHLALLGLPEAVRKLAMGLGEDVTAKTMFSLAEAHRAHVNGKRSRAIAPKLGEREAAAAHALVASEFQKMGTAYPPPGEEDGVAWELALAIGAEAARRRGLFRQEAVGGDEKSGEQGTGEKDGATGGGAGGGARERPSGRRRTRDGGAAGEEAEIRILPGRLREVLAGEKVPEAVIRRVLAAIGG